MKFLTIIVKYNNKVNDLYRTLDSIERLRIQKDVETIVVSNDNTIKKEVIKKYRHSIKIINRKEKLGALYQNALEMTESNFVTFLNSNDMFIQNGILATIDILKKENPRILKTNFKERYLELNGELKVGTLDTSLVETIRSYFFRVDYIKTSFQFNSELNIFFEENFYEKVFLTSDYAVYSSDTIISEYSIVKVNDNMLSRHSQNIDEFYLMACDCLSFLIDSASNNINFYIARFILSFYIIVASLEFQKPTLRDKKEYYEKVIFDLFFKYKEEFIAFDNKTLDNIFKREFERQRRNNIYLKLTEDFGTFMDRLNAKYKDENRKNRLLDIIIPEYNGEKYIFNLLDSISSQKNIDFSEIGIIIVDDCSDDKIQKYKFKKYPKLNITFLVNETNVGPGLSRQHGIDESKADFVTFMDCDDEFYDDTSFAKMVVFIKEHEPNIAKGSFAEEMPDGKLRIYGPTDATQFLHGMFFKRQFLVDNNYRFDDRIRVAEDSYFTTIVLSDTPANLFNHIVYLWKYNKKSLVRSDESAELFHIKHILDIIYSGVDAALFLEKKNSNSTEKTAINAILFPYILLTSYVFKNVDSKLIKKYEFETYKNYLLLKQYFDSASNDKKKQYYDSMIKSLSRSLPAIKPFESFDDFISRMQKEYPDL